MEALAMAGADYQEWGLSIEEWEFQESVVPPHLLADDAEKDEEEDHQNEDDRVFDCVEVKQSRTCDIAASVGELIEQSVSHIIVHLKLLKFLRHLLENFLFIHVLDFIV
ncbi:hypothetical protein Bca52824_046141 [Brassica carinata]|uniref:Uncharacterized protein n=1 Tax=Brassica carinata TaxID=52824 RepID=A0A8X7REI9_BRACI|nr:hypothetical protein Bca52824_046141 [Brassica carinata]